MNKITIPTILIATVLVAGIFAFMPVDEAVTVHNTILASDTGIACAAQAVDMGAEIDLDTILFTFDQAILITGISFNGDANLLGDTLGFTTVVTVDGYSQDLTFGAFEEILDDTPDLTWQNEGPFTTNPIYVSATIAFVADDNDGTAIEANDDFIVTFCGITENAGNFDGTDVDFAITEA